MTAQEKQILRSEVGIEELALASWNAFTIHDTASRSVMFTGHIPSCLLVSNPTIQTVSTLVNYEYAKYTFKSKFKHNGELLKVVPLYRFTGDRNSIKENPLETYIYYNDENNELSCLEHKRHFRLGSSNFGYEYKINKEVEDQIFHTRRIQKDMVLGDTPNIDEDGEYRIGVQANVLLGTLPGVVEDGMIISESFANKTKFKMQTTYVISFGNEFYPLNLYGNPDEGTYKIHPDIGEYVRDDGLLIALRKRDPIADITNQNKYRLTEYDPFFDKPTFDYRGAKVIDVRVFSEHVTDPNNPTELVTARKMSTPDKMAEQPLKYIRARKHYLREIYNTYLAEKKRDPGLKLSKEMNTLVFEAIQDESNFLQMRKGAGAAAREKLTKAYRKVPLDDYRIEITVEREITPTVQNKYTGFDGDNKIH